MSAAAFTVEDLYLDLTEGAPIGALNITQSDYSHLATKKGNLISFELKLSTSRKQNIRDAKKRIKTFSTRSLRRAGSLDGQNYQQSQKKNLERFHNNALPFSREVIIDGRLPSIIRLAQDKAQGARNDKSR
jgi:hypothetical protein